MKCFIHLVFVGFLVAASLAISAQAPVTKNDSRRCGETAANPGGPKLSKTKFVPLRTAVGDLTRDGIDETAVLVRDMVSSGLVPDEVFIYGTQEKETRLLVRFAVGEPGEYVLSIKSLDSSFSIENGSLILDLAVRRGADDYVPRHFRTLVFRWDGSKMAEISRSAAKPLPQNKLEKG
jgi:hypothetical protein